MPELLYFLASAGNLFLANLVIFRARRARGALPVALLCIALFVWDIGESAKIVLKDDYWSYIRLVGSSAAPAFLWHFVVVFVRRDQALRKWLVALYAATAAFTGVTSGAIFSQDLRDFVGGPAWNLVYLGVLFPFLVWSLVLLRRRAREVELPVERNAVHFVAFGVAVGAFTGLTELTAILWERVPRLGHVGSALCTLVLAVAILRHRLLEQQVPARKTLFVFLMVLSAAFVLMVLNPALPGKWDAVLLVGAVVGVTTLALYRLLYIRWYEQGERRKRLAFLGTMAAGVAHEVKNPLGAIKGAAQYVLKDLEGDAGKASAREYLKLMVDEVDRLNGVVESFLAYARPMEPRRKSVVLPELMDQVLKLQSASMPASIAVRTAYDLDLPPVPADPDLLTQVLTNVIRNAIEVMPEGGTLSLGTRVVTTALRTYAAVDVADTGPGIPRDSMERIFQPFFTTKAKGTGLGLAIARQVVESHGGEIAAENVEPRGCKFTFLLPLPGL